MSEDMNEHTPLPDDGSRDLWRWGIICGAAYNRARQTNSKAADALRPAMMAIIKAGLLSDDRAIASPTLLARVRELEEALKEAIDVFDGMNDDEINAELLPKLRSALADWLEAVMRWQKYVLNGGTAAERDAAEKEYTEMAGEPMTWTPDKVEALLKEYGDYAAMHAVQQLASALTWALERLKEAEDEAEAMTDAASKAVAERDAAEKLRQHHFDLGVQHHKRAVAAEAERDAANARAASVVKENDTLRRIVANSDELCVYCGLTKVNMAKCEHGFPGCHRADDMNIQEAGK